MESWRMLQRDKIQPDAAQYDLVIIGAGAAGLAAAVSYAQARQGCADPAHLASDRGLDDGNGIAHEADGADPEHLDSGHGLDNGKGIAHETGGTDPAQSASDRGRDDDMGAAETRAGSRVLLLDRNAQVGRKLLATGNGRCNLTNRAATGFAETVAFFESLGLLLTEDDEGRYYPMSRQAVSVQNALLSEAERLGVELALNVKAISVGIDVDGTDGKSGVHGENGFVVVVAENLETSKKNSSAHGSQKMAQRLQKTNQTHGSREITQAAHESQKTVRTKQLIIATGGQAGAQYGSLGDGYRFARRLGHRVRSTRPVLVPLVYPDRARQEFAMLKGVRIRAEVALLRRAHGDIGQTGQADCRILAKDKGEVQFTGDGISGICIFNLSRYIRDGAIESASGSEDRVEPLGAEGLVGASSAEDRMEPPCLEDRAKSFDAKDHMAPSGAGTLMSDLYVRMDLAPDISKKSLVDLLTTGRVAGLQGILPVALADFIGTRADGVMAAAHMIKHFEIPIAGTKGWKEAQVTSGGVEMGEIDESRMMSHIVSGLYFAGEVLDFDAPSGGYNLDFAWNSGMRAGQSAAQNMALTNASRDFA
jgi:predicted flavoprotein YhiN